MPETILSYSSPSGTPLRVLAISIISGLFSVAATLPFCLGAIFWAGAEGKVSWNMLLQQIDQSKSSASLVESIRIYRMELLSWPFSRDHVPHHSSRLNHVPPLTNAPSSRNVNYHICIYRTPYYGYGGNIKIVIF